MREIPELLRSAEEALDNAGYVYADDHVEQATYFAAVAQAEALIAIAKVLDCILDNMPVNRVFGL